MSQAQVSEWTPATIRFYSFEAGYGFAIYGQENDIFFHQNLLRDKGYSGSLHTKAPIELRYIKSPRGLRAVDIRTPK